MTKGRSVTICSAIASGCLLVLSLAQTASAATAREVARLSQRRVAVPAVATSVPGDTVFVGWAPSHWYDNYWSIGTGPRRPPSQGGMWDWDSEIHGDTLQGWWPIHELYSNTAGLTVSDDWRPWWATDQGNSANYVLNSSTPAPHRAIGVVGVWHVDQGNAAAAANGVTWSPLSGGSSAWMGLRRHGDTQFSDPVTGRAFNEDLLQYAGDGWDAGNVHGFPGYGSQMDQMLYHDLVPAAGQPLSVSFLYRTRMSTSANLAAATRTGWFHGDPLAVAAGNFISSTTAGANSPVDSFMVYIGVPVNDAACVYSDGVTRPVGDPQRRWFSEVLRIFEGSSVPYYRIFGASGNQPASPASATPLFSTTIPATYVDAIRNATGNTGNRLRLVFRVKTNRGFDDEGVLYSSGGAGAVVIDDVVVQGATIGSFETLGQIDNTQSALTAWRSTGKPPAIYPHVEPLDGLTFNDLMGPPNSPMRQHNMEGGVVVTGNHDDTESAFDRRFISEREGSMGLVSPTIQLCGPYDHVEGTNAMGVTEAQADPTDDYYAAFDVYDGVGNQMFTGSYYSVGCQCYPVLDRNGNPGWGQIRLVQILNDSAEPTGTQQLIALRANGLIVTSNASGVPDSIRIVLSKSQECFAWAVSLGCNSNDGLYFDNVSLALVNSGVAAPPGPPTPLIACAANTWALASTTGPSARYQHAMVGNTGRGIVVMFGGKDAAGAVMDDTWEWDGSTWAAVSYWTGLGQRPHPAARARHSLAYDSKRDRVLIFGGVGASGSLRDMWSYNVSTQLWSQIPTDGAWPTARAGMAMAYDSERDRVVLYGGNDGVVKSDLWEWNPETGTWSLVPASGPGPVQNGFFVYDDVRGQLCLFGGETGTVPRSDVWDWDGDEWANLHGTNTLPAGTAAAYGDQCGSTVVFGGVGNPGTATSYWNGSSYTSVSEGFATRFDHAMAYDATSERIILFGGKTASGTVVQDTWGWCCSCGIGEAETDTLGEFAGPLNWDRGPIQIEDFDQVLAELDPELDTDNANNPCPTTVGGTITRADTTDNTLTELASLGITGVQTTSEIGDSLKFWDAYILSHFAGPGATLANAGPVMANYSRPTSPHVPPVGKCYVLGGRDLVFVLGLRLGPVTGAMAGDIPDMTPWVQVANIVDSTSNTNANPLFYGTGHFAADAEAYWHKHIERYFADKHIANRYVIVSWSSAQRMENGVLAVLSQIGDAMQYGKGVVDPSGSNDKSNFGTPGYVIVSHSTGGLMTDAAMRSARRYPNLNAEPVWQLCKAQVAIACAFDGSDLARVAVATALIAKGVFPSTTPWLCPLFKWLFEWPADCSNSSVMDAVTNSVLVDLVPVYTQKWWSAYEESTTVPAVLVVGGHPSYMLPLKQVLHLGFDDGVLNVNSEAANTNPVRHGPASYEATKLRHVVDMGITIKRRAGYLMDQLVDVRANSSTRRVASGPIAQVSPTGMVQPVRREYLADQWNPLNRYGNSNTRHNHFSYILAASNHAGSVPESEGWNDANYLDTDYYLLPTEHNSEEARVISDQQIYEPTPSYVPYGYGDTQPLLAREDRPHLEYRMRARTVTYWTITKGRFVRHKKYIWRRDYKLLLGWQSNMAMDYVYNSILRGNNLAACNPPGTLIPDVGMQVDGADLFHDTFPANEIDGLAGTPLFDTTTALIKTGRNIAQAAYSSRFDVPGDSLVVCACGSQMRLDLVFRILPGPGNYQIAAGRFHSASGGTPTGQLLQLPTNQAVLAVSGDASFWGQYMADPGAFSAGHHDASTRWNPNTWNSARMDTAEINLFPIQRIGNLPRLNPCIWSSTYHELDPKFSTLGIPKFRCFVLDTAGQVASPNISCSSVPAWATSRPGSGYDGSSTTREYTKILPDGLFTPGTHVEYFIRRSSIASPSIAELVPDTTTVTPQPGIGSSACNGYVHGTGSEDGFRWNEFSVLPDRWKGWEFGGSGMACMLYVDLNDGHGDERAWTQVAEMIGATSAASAGGHNGWHAASLTADPNDAAGFVRDHRGQAGTTWDKFDVKGIDLLVDGNAGALGSRLSNRASSGLVSGKWSRIGPTKEMLRTYYGIVYLTSGNLMQGLLGPLLYRSQDDIALLSDFLVNPWGTPQPRGIFTEGSSFVQSEGASASMFSSHGTFLRDYLGLSLRNSSYVSVSGNLDACVALQTTTEVGPDPNRFAVLAPGISNDVLQLNPLIPEARMASKYIDWGIGSPYFASVLKPVTTWSRPWIALTDGFDIKSVGSRYCENSNGRAAYLYNAFNTVFGSICQVTGPPLSTTDAPPFDLPLTNFVRLLNNPMRVGPAIVEFGLVRRAGVTVRIYDVAGRMVRELADQPFAAGVHHVNWDRTSRDGTQLQAGIFFVRVQIAGEPGAMNRKMILIH